MQILAGLYSEESQQYGASISLVQFEALYVVSICAPLDQVTLARRIGADRATTTTTVRTLERRKLITRTVPSDKRRRTLKLTAGGTRELASARKAAMRSVSKLLRPLEQRDRDRLIHVLYESALQRRSPAPRWTALEDESDVLPRSQRRSLEWLYRMPFFLMDRCTQVGTAYMTQTLAPYGLSAGQAGCLIFIATLGPLDQKGLCSAIGIDRSSVRVILQALTRRGLISQKADTMDRRRRVVECTDAGIKLLDEIQPMFEQMPQQIFEGMAADLPKRISFFLSRLVAAHQNLRPDQES